MSASRYVYWTGSMETDFAPNHRFTSSGITSGTISMVFKTTPTGSQIAPAIHFSFSNNFRTSGSIEGTTDQNYSLYLIKLTGNLPRRYRIWYTTTYSSATNGHVASSGPGPSWGFLFGATNLQSQTEMSGFVGQGLVLGKAADSSRAHFAKVENGVCRIHDAPVAYPELSSGTLTNNYIDVEMLSLTGAYHGGTFWTIEGGQTTRGRLNETTKQWSATKMDQNWLNGLNGMVYSGSKWEGKKLDTLYLAFWNPFTGTTIRDTFELENLAIIEHPRGPGRTEIVPAPLTMSLFGQGESKEPSVYSGSLTYWTTPSGSNIVVSTNKVQKLNRFSGTTRTFSNVAASCPFTSSLLVGATTYPTALFSASGVGSSFLSSSHNADAYISASAWHNFYTLNIRTGTTTDSVTIYNNHIIHGDTLGYWGIYHQNNNNGSGTIHCYAYDGAQITCSFAFKYNETILIEYWKDQRYIYGRLNNLPTYISAAIGVVQPDLSVATLSKATDPGTSWHLFEMITSNANSNIDDGAVGMNSIGIGNYLAGRYGFNILSSTVAVGGERW